MSPPGTRGSNPSVALERVEGSLSVLHSRAGLGGVHRSHQAAPPQQSTCRAATPPGRCSLCRSPPPGPTPIILYFGERIIMCRKWQSFTLESTVSRPMAPVIFGRVLERMDEAV